ncbi:sterol O-acyltransferase 1 [Diachasma alloeum]|uniref:sterol O-acyltransferase 1 n=1 Tax=Diachasma alloeum TaxID=454923 RepID=UPI0007384898|nr:sterol O-acyltransferase 1 [Diachasma alloeum]XP_015119001.1 sterol O-acyltransferase 1 [Diachasma alloeum]
MHTEDVKERMQAKLRDVLDEVGDRLNDIVTEAVDEGIESIANFGAVRNNAGDTFHMDKRKTQRSEKLAEKHFKTRNSLLTDLFNEDRHIKAAYNIWLIILCLLFLHTISHDLIENGTMEIGIMTISTGLAQFAQVIKIWFFMTLLSFTVYGFHSFWAHQRLKFQPKSMVLKVWDYTWLSLSIAYQSAFLFFPARAVFLANFPPPCALIITMEQMRMMMKIHAFVRSTSSRVISHKLHTEGKKMNFPRFSKFLYFMFAPTLVYRDNYPSTKTIRWSFVISNFRDVIYISFFIAFLYERFIFPTYRDWGRNSVSVRGFAPKYFNSVLPALGMYLCGFYCLLHAWSNAWAELLKFGDRLFYKDWWTATSLEIYFRKWNVIVHDWLYTYLYKDFYEIIVPGNKYVASFMVFAISSIFHEYILSVSFRLFYPMMFVLFMGTGYPLVYVTRKTSVLGNLFLWFLLVFGNAILLSFYSIEYFARMNCPEYGDVILDLFMPKSFFCNNTNFAN